MTKACTEFVLSVKAHDHTLLNRPKFHLLLHLPECIENFGVTSSFSAERYIYQHNNNTDDDDNNNNIGANLLMEK